MPFSVTPNMEEDQNFLDQFSHHFLRINGELNGNFSTQVPFVKEIVHHSLMGEGKRLRPLLFVLSAQLSGYKGEDIYYYSTIFEGLHTSSLLHDDVLDNAEMRRRKPSVNHVWGNAAAVLGGDFLYSKSFRIALSSHSIRFLEVLTDTANRMAEGQMLELMHTHNWYLTRDEYMEIIVSKTAVLISASCACGAIISGAGEAAIDHLREFGLNLGIAFQLIDDLLDYISSEDEFGKPVGKDLKEGKITLPLIYTLEDLKMVEIDWLQDLFKNHKERSEDHRKVVDLVRDKGVIDRIRAEARVYVEKALGFLNFFPPSQQKDHLAGLNSYILKRRF